MQDSRLIAVRTKLSHYVWYGNFPTLTSLYKNLVSLVLTGRSAERVMSRIRNLKSRLRSTMADDCLAGLLIAVAPRYRYCSGATFTVAVAVAPLLLAESSADSSAATFLAAF